MKIQEVAPPPVTKFYTLTVSRSEYMSILIALKEKVASNERGTWEVSRPMIEEMEKVTVA